MADIRINPAGIRELLRSSNVRNDLERRAGRIATMAGPGMETRAETGPHRARAAVITATFPARYAEANRRSLTRAIDAGR